MEHDLADRSWSRNWTAAIGQAVRRYRTRANLTAEQLSTMTAELGYPLSRNAITALETGRKEFFNVQDLMVLAVALRVVPALLLFPVDETLDPVELLPGMVQMDRIEAVDWLSGEDDVPEFFPGMDSSEGRRTWMLNNNVLFWLRGHADGIRRWLHAVEREAKPGITEEVRHHSEVLRVDAERQIRANRAQLEAAGRPLPDLPPGLNVEGKLVDPLGRKNVAAMLLPGRAHERSVPASDEPEASL